MRFTTSRTRIGDDQVRHRNLLESDECPMEGIASAQQQQLLIRTLADTPTLQMCGTQPFDKLKMSHNGIRWVLELEAVTKGSA